jgi:hypothetical protein
MTKTRYDFIKELLVEKKMNSNQRERILELASKEFSYEGTLEQRIQKIEELIFRENTDEEKKIIFEQTLGSGTQKIADLNNELHEINSKLNDAFGDDPDKVSNLSDPRYEDVDRINTLNTTEIDELSNLANLFGDSESKGKKELKQFKGLKRQGGTEEKPKYYDPYKLYEFLFHYNQNLVLRYTCHDIDEDALTNINARCNSETYDFTAHLKIIIEEFEKHSKQYFAPKIAPLIRGYLTGKGYTGSQLQNGWSTDKIREGWSSVKLSHWAEQNPGIPPNWNEDLAEEKDIELFPIEPQIKSPISFEPIQNFTQLTLHFKNLFHVKYGNESLKAILKRVNEFKKWNDVIDIVFDEHKFPDNLEHFTSVDKVRWAYVRLLESIVEKHNIDGKPKVKLGFYEENQCVYLSIHHVNGVYKKTIQNTLERDGEKLSLLIEKQINGLCNLILKADFGGSNYAEINLWNGKERQVIPLDNFQGVQFLLEFPKIKRS